MAGKTKIAWADKSWNPIRGCSRVSEGCRHCYAENMAGRFSGSGQPYEGLATRGRNGFRWTGKIRFIEKDLELPFRWRKSSLVFVNSMSDLFHDNVQEEWIHRIIEVMRSASWHNFLVLTKRPKRMVEVCKSLQLPQNVWIGVSIESEDHLDRLNDLYKVDANVRWISAEPLLGPLPEMDLSKCHWVVTCGESGPKARPVHIQWFSDIIHQCRDAGIPVFVKQMGTHWARENLGNRTKAEKPTEWPEELRVREYPKIEVSLGGLGLAPSS